MMKNLLLFILMIGLGTSGASGQTSTPDSVAVVSSSNDNHSTVSRSSSGTENPLAGTSVNVIRGEVINMLYPNPAGAAVNVVFDEHAGVHSVAVLSMLGKPVKVYKVSGNSARVEIDDVPAGVYFLRLMNGQGHVIATRRFNHQ